MAADKTLFAPVPLRAMAMDLSGQLLRVLVAVVAHDRMSLATGKGQGCRASNERMAQMVGCPYARLCSSLSELVDRGLLQRTKEGRHTVFRAIYDDADNLRFRDLWFPSKGSRTVSAGAAIGYNAPLENGRNPPNPESNIFPERGGIDSEESGEENSVETAQLALRGSPRGEELSLGAQLAMLERRFRQYPDDLDLPYWVSWLETLAADGFDGTSDGGRATRLYDELVEALSPEDYAEWADGVRRAVNE